MQEGLFPHTHLALGITLWFFCLSERQHTNFYPNFLRKVVHVRGCHHSIVTPWGLWKSDVITLKTPALGFVRWQLSPWGGWPFPMESKPRGQSFANIWQLFPYPLPMVSQALGNPWWEQMVSVGVSWWLILALPPHSLQVTRGLPPALPIFSLMADLSWPFGLEIFSSGKRARG